MHDPSSRVTIDHSAWALFLNTYLRASPDGINRIPYAKVSDADKRRLANYVATLETIPISRYHRNEQLAYWINLYNAATIKLVLDHYPIQSIFDIKISPGLFSAGPWGKKFLEVEREKLSLDDIEHRILRPVWQDPRIHYAVNCASVGCPNLMDEPFTGANAETLLTVAARDYINHERGVMLRDGRLVVSRIYEWYKEDFDSSDEGVIRHFYSVEMYLDGSKDRDPRQLDLFWPLWHLLDLTPEGRGTDWFPRYSYSGESANCCS